MKTVKVKIAVEVNANGKWQVEAADEYFDEKNPFRGWDVGNPYLSKFYWITAELAVPDGIEAMSVLGKVEDATQLGPDNWRED